VARDDAAHVVFELRPFPEIVQEVEWQKDDESVVAG